MTTLQAVALIALGLGAGQSGGSKPPDPLRLPAEFEGYRQWGQLLKSPYQVPMEFWTRCMAITPKEWAKAREKYGPHTERYMRVYGNDVAARGLKAAGKSTFPVGTIVAKEKLVSEPHGPAVGVAFMVKRREPPFRDTGGWEFLYFPTSGDARATHDACASCHRGAAATDYIFGQYPR